MNTARKSDASSNLRQSSHFMHSDWLKTSFDNLSQTVKSEVEKMILCDVPVETVELYAQIRNDTYDKRSSAEEWGQQEFRILNNKMSTQKTKNDLQSFTASINRFIPSVASKYGAVSQEMLFIGTVIMLYLRKQHGEVVTAAMKSLYNSDTVMEFHKVSELIQTLKNDYPEYPTEWMIEAII